MGKPDAESLDPVDVDFEVDEESDQDDDGFVESIPGLQLLQSKRTARSEIEIRRELFELRKATGDYYEKDIFD